MWSLADSWGNFEIDNNTAKVNVFEGKINLKSVSLKFCDNISNVKVDGKDIDFKFENGTICFDEQSILNCVEIEI